MINSKITAKQMSAIIVHELYKSKLIADRNIKESITIIEKCVKNIAVENKD